VFVTSEENIVENNEVNSRVAHYAKWDSLLQDFILIIMSVLSDDTVRLWSKRQRERQRNAHVLFSG